MAKEGRIFYGWLLLPIAWVLYGFGITPAYNGWGIFVPEIIKDLGLTRGDIGGVFGVFTFLYSGVGPFVGLAMERWGIRPVMIFGFVMSAIGFIVTARGDSVLDFYIGFALLGGGGIGFATIVPCQTLAQNWFVLRRALAIAIIFTAGGVVGRIFPEIDRYMIEHYGWRAGWLLIAAVSFTLAVVAAILVRDSPEHVGQRPDGEPPDDTEGAAGGEGDNVAVAKKAEWTAWQAIRTPQFALVVLCGIAYALPWGVVAAHGPLHLGDRGLAEAAPGLIGTMFLVSILGRLSGSLGDWFPPQAVLAAAILIETIGFGLFFFVDNTTLGYISVVLLGLGFGAGYISVPVVFSSFFGRKAFGTTSGTRIFITGIFNALAPWLAGEAYDRLNSYFIPFATLTVLGVIGMIAAAMARHPGDPKTALEEPPEPRVAP